jgi:peptide/nickel transport system permease protein
MRAYIARRLLLVIPTVLLSSFAAYVLGRMIPGDIIDAMEARIRDQEIDRTVLEKTLGLDEPMLVQYGRWMGVVPQTDGRLDGLLQGNLGTSWWEGVSVVSLVALKWPVTVELGLMGLVIAQIIALPIGIVSALRQKTAADYIGRTFAILCISVPGFWIATLVIVFPSIWWGYMPPIMLIRFADDPLGNLKMFIVPAAILGMALAGLTMRMTRTMMLEVLRQDYVRTAWAKGLNERLVIVRHALKNALIPVVTIVGLQMPLLIGGTVIIENIFNLPGMGRLIIAGITNRDEPLISAVVFIFSFGLVMINLLVDLTYSFLDPRVRYQ